MMKGLTAEYIAILVMAIISLGIFFLLTGTLFSGESHDTYMAMPRGVWMSLESADTKTFVLPPVVWFGEGLIVDGDTTLDFSKIYDETNRNSRDFVFPTNNVYIKEYIGIPNPDNFDYLPLLTNILFFPGIIPVSIPARITFDIRKPISPVIAFYPLLTDNFGGSPESPVVCDSDICHLNTEESFGKVDLTLTIDLNELKKYYGSKNYRFDESPDNVNLSVKYIADRYSEKNNYLKTLGVDENSLSITDLINMDDPYGNKVCKEVSGKYECSFVFSVVDECCPSFVNIEPVLEVYITANDGVKVWETEKIDSTYFQIVYYLDVLGDRKSIYDFKTLQENLFKDNSGATSVNDILIYPCRAKVPDGIDVSNLYRDVKDFEGRDINWDQCRSVSKFIQLEYLDLDPDSTNPDRRSTWFCMEENNEYHLYNPYAFCRLDGTELPVSPKPTYLRGIIPYSNFAKKVDNIPFYLGPLWIPKEGWDVYIARTPEFDYKNYKEAAWVCAVSIIDKTIKAIKNNEDAVFFKDINIGGITISYNFD